jgi:hypothetical protein
MTRTSRSFPWAAVVVGLVLLAGAVYIILNMSWRTFFVLLALGGVITVILLVSRSSSD